MSYAEEAQKYGKQPVQIVEIYLDYCDLEYGVSPCMAVLGTTGSQKCYKTCATCQDRENYVHSPRPYRFSTVRVDEIQQVGDPPTFPTLLSVKTASTVLQPGKGLGIRSSLSITISDHPWTDIGTDPYVSTRSANPDSKGSFWGKFISRNKFYENRRIDVLTGFLNEQGKYVEANFKRRTYIITKISGPGPQGTVSIEAKDPLRLADGEKAKWPKASQATLASDINNTTTSISINDPDGSITSWWNLGQRYIRIEDEIVKASAITGLSTASPILTVDRAELPAWYEASSNIAYAHAAGASIQPCHLFDDAPVYDIVYFLLNSVAGIDPAYLPLADWTAAIESEGFQYLVFSALLVEPVDVKTLLEEISQHTVLIWWDERASVVRLKGLRFQALLAPQVNDDTSIVSESVSVTEDVSALLTQNWLYFDLQWPLANMSLLRSYRVVDVRANLDKESDDEYARSAIKQTKSRWLNRSMAGVAKEIGFTMLKQYQDVRKAVTWVMDPKDDAVWVGDTVGIATKYIQDENGDTLVKNLLITQVEEMFSAGSYKLKYVGMELFSFTRVGVITHPDWTGEDPIPAPPDYSLASAPEKAHWAFICYDGSYILITEAGDTLTTEDDIPLATGDDDDTPRFLDGQGAYQIV